MNFSDLYIELDRRFPRSLSAPWDNDGIMCRASDELGRVLIALDATDGALDYASSNGFGTVLTHHPLIFRPLSALDGESASSARVIKALRCGVNVISFHTRLDAGEGGVNDTLLKLLGFDASGVFGSDDAPNLGRIANTESMPLQDLASRVRDALGCHAVRVTGQGDVSRIAVCGGDGGSMLRSAALAGADVIITGDVGYNAAEEAAEFGLSVIEAGHYHTEFPVCMALSDILDELRIESEVYEACPNEII